MSVSTFYFDVSVSGPTDPGGVWINDANAFDGIEGNDANTDQDGSKSSNYLEGKGTNASGSGSITQVRARIMSSGSDGNYATLDTPAGGWTWDKLSKLETRVWDVGNPFAPTIYAGIYVEGDAGGTELGTPERSGVLISILQIEVTYTEDDTPIVGVKYPLPAFKRP